MESEDKPKASLRVGQHHFSGQHHFGEQHHNTFLAK